MTKREFIDSNGNSWEWEETSEVTKAVARLHEDIRTRETRYKKEGVDTSEN